MMTVQGQGQRAAATLHKEKEEESNFPSRKKWAMPGARYPRSARALLALLARESPAAPVPLPAFLAPLCCLAGALAEALGPVAEALVQ